MIDGTLTNAFWLNLLLFVVVTGAGGVGTLLFFVLRGIRDNQVRIWEWAISEVAELNKEIRNSNDRHAKDSLDNRRWVRHELRSMYMELLAVLRLIGTKESREIEASINKRLSQGGI